ncbi:unnamed protein product [Symbiodinium microadriaticum]|nr:unnamed protein product [Symbiodinium microadriaticum]
MGCVMCRLVSESILGEQAHDSPEEEETVRVSGDMQRRNPQETVVPSRTEQTFVFPAAGDQSGPSNTSPVVLKNEDINAIRIRADAPKSVRAALLAILGKY